MTPLTLALPSKGRLRDDAIARLADAGYAVETENDARAYRAGITGRPEIEVAFLSAGEIARELAAGSVHLGVTGEDLLRESVPRPEEATAVLSRLGFGHADVVVAVPELWIDVWSMSDLDDVAAGFRARHGRRLRVATKYWNLTQGFFASHGVALYRIVESLGATEGAPASGAAEVIVDITSTGSTLKANHLKVLSDGVILRSEAVLALSRRAAWSGAQRTAGETFAGAVNGARDEPIGAIFEALGSRS